MFKMKTKIILLLFIVVFISSAVLLYMVTQTFKKDKISYVYEAITSETQSVASQIKNELDSLDLYLSKISLKPDEQDQLNEYAPLKYFSVVKIENENPVIVNEFVKENFTKDLTLVDRLIDGAKKIEKIDFKFFVAKNDIIYQVVLSQIQPQRIIAIIGFESDAIEAFINDKKDEQFSFVLNTNLDILAGDNKNLEMFSAYIQENKTKKWEDIQSGQITSNKKEPWIFSLSSISGTDLKVVNLVSEKKAFSVLKTIYLKSIFSFILILSFVVILGIFSATYLTDKLNRLTIATKKVTQGELNAEVEISGDDEISSLSKDFNVMVRQIKKLLSETAEQARMETELKTAQLVQENLFPESEMSYLNCSIRGYCKPASECGGDWWFHCEDSQYVNIIIADATGHGVSAALMTSAIKSAFILTAKLELSSQDTMTKINEALCEVGRRKVMMTAFYLRINKKTNSAEYINASHEAPFILDLNRDNLEKSDLIFLNENNSARLGQSNDTLYTISQIQLASKQRIFLYTDGIFDLKNNDLKKLTERYFYRNVLDVANARTSFEDYSHEIKNFIFDYHTQKTLDDDVTLCHVEIT